MFHAVKLLSEDGGGPDNRCGGKVQKAWEFAHPRCGAVLDSKGTSCLIPIKRYLDHSCDQVYLSRIHTIPDQPILTSIFPRQEVCMVSLVILNRCFMAMFV